VDSPSALHSETMGQYACCLKYMSLFWVPQVCNSTKVTPFKIVAKNEERGQPEASYVRSVKVYLPHDTVVELQKSRRVMVRNTILFHI